LRYFDAIDTNHLELELGDALFAINAWSKDDVDVIGAMHAQEYDATIFGSMEVMILMPLFLLGLCLFYFFIASVCSHV
jgi:hypothetical protein